MKKGYIKIKDNISLVDKINAVNLIVSNYFIGGDYTPYYVEISKSTAIVKFFIEGIEFEEDEDIYACYMADRDLYDLVQRFYNQYQDDSYFYIMDEVMSMVEDKVAFTKERLIHSSDALNTIAEFCDVITGALSNFSKLNISQMSEEELSAGLEIMKKMADTNFSVESLAKVLKEAVDYDIPKADAEIIEAKNVQIKERDNKIAELLNYKAMMEANASSNKEDN